MKIKNNFNLVLILLLMALTLIETGCLSRHHIRKLRKPDICISDTIKAFIDYERKDFIEMEKQLKVAQERAYKSEFMKSITETIFLVVDNQVAFTVIINGADVKIERGRMQKITPTLLIPFTTAIAKNLIDVLEDYKLDKQEIFNISYVVFMPCLNRMYSMPYLFESPIFKGKLDNFLQFVIVNPEGYTYHGRKIEISGTVVNVDGMFITMPGLVGDPDVRLELTLEQAMEIYKYIAYDALKDQPLSEKRKLFARYSALVEKCTVYKRSWH